MIRTFTGEQAYLLAAASHRLPEVSFGQGMWRPARVLGEARAMLSAQPSKVRLVADPRVLLEGMTGEAVDPSQFADRLAAARSNPTLSPTLLDLLEPT